MKSKLTFGSDPELFAKKIVNGKPFVVPPVFFRTELNYKIIREEPRHPVFKELKINENENIKIHEDGCAFELTVPPRHSMKEIFELIQQGYNGVDDIVKQYGLEKAVIPTINFDTNEFKNSGPEFQECLIFGCDPDLDAFDYNRKQEVENALEHPYRYGGGHIHISGSNLLEKFPLVAVKLLANTIGNFVTANTPMKKLDHLRVHRYGRPGKYRIQRYPNKTIGVEYRTPSNAWTNSLELSEGIQYWAEIAVLKLLPNKAKAKEVMNAIEENTVKAIVNTDTGLALNNLNAVKTILSI